jgi:alkylation response protein AidB-like acyl-CoA dehydrogenase
VDFSWTEEQIKFRQNVIQFAQQELQGNLVDLDWREEFNREGWQKCGEFGLIGLPIPQQYGGSEADILTTIYGLEALGYGCKDNGLIFALNAQIWACEIPILTFGSEAQKQKYLPKLCKGELIGAHAASEPDAGSDIYSLKTTAQRQGDTYILNGTKNWVTNGPVADLNIVFANVAPEKGKRGITGFLVEKDFPGVVMNRKISKMGLRTTQLGELVLENCEVSVENRLGQEGAGLAIFNHSMEWERGFILASAIGTMERLMETCLQYAKKRQQFGQAIGKFQLISSKIVEMKLRLETARNLLYKMGWLKQIKKSAILEAAMVKLYISESWVQTCLDAIQIHGGYGYLTELELERELRDALGSKVYSGTSEIQYQIIAQMIGL